MTTRKIFLAGNRTTIRDELKRMDLPEVHDFDHIENIDFSSGEIVCVDFGDSALGMAEGLTQRGIARSRLSYVTLPEADRSKPARESWAPLIIKPRHFHWEDAQALADLEFDPALVKVYKSGVDFLDMNLQWGWRLPELGVIAGTYGSGKSTFGQYLAATFVDGPGRELNASALLCSWEDIGHEVKNNVNNYQMHSDNYSDLLDKIHFVVRGPNNDRLISWYKDLVRYYHERYNTKFFLLDPWNEMDHVKDSRTTETEYVREVLKDLRKLVDELKVILIVATHVPAKLTKGNGEIEPFKIAHSFGSSQFGNKADRGLCILRAKKWNEAHGHTILRLDKAKIEGKMGTKATVGLRFDKERFRYEYDAYVTDQVQDLWKD